MARAAQATNRIPLVTSVTWPIRRYHAAVVAQKAATGFTHIALVQVGADSQEKFISQAASDLLPALRAQ